MKNQKFIALALLIFVFSASAVNGKLTLKEIRTATDKIVVAYFTSDTLDLEETDISRKSEWLINGTEVSAISKYASIADKCDHYIYLVTEKLQAGNNYMLQTPYGNKEFIFNDREIFCESIKTNQAGYSALSGSRFANFAVWLGDDGATGIEGPLPEYEVFDVNSGDVVMNGTLLEVGNDKTSGDFVYRIDLSKVLEGGPYKICVKGFGSSYPFGVGGEFVRRAAYLQFRAQYLQRCGCPVVKPDIREKACHTIIYDVDGPIGEANIVVKGNEPTFKCYGGYHDAGDADRRAYHMANPILNLMIYEAFPEYFYDGQYDIPGEFDEEYNIKNYLNNIPDIIDEAEWGTLAWEYLQNEDGSIHFGTETKGYPDPFAAPMDKDDKKYGTVRVDARATCTGAGLFMHMARLLKPYKPDRSEELRKRAEKAFIAGIEEMALPEILYYNIQKYLLTGEEEYHDIIWESYEDAVNMEDHIFETPGYSLNDAKFDNPAYIWSYVVETELPTDPEIVEYFKSAVKKIADRNLEELDKCAYPVGNSAGDGGWGHNVRQPLYASAPMLYWSISKEAKYIDGASQLLDYKLGLNPMGISYVTQLGFNQVHNPHDRESEYTKNKGWGPKPGITVFGPGIPGWRWKNIKTYPGIKEFPKERQFADDMGTISFTEFTIFETMQHDALYTVLAGGGKWDGKDPFRADK